MMFAPTGSDPARAKVESKAHPAISSLSLAFDIGLLGRTAAFLDATGLCNLEACARFVQGAFHATSSNPEEAPWRRAAVQRGLCVMESSSLLLSAEIHRRLKRFYGKLSLVTSPANWLWPIHGLDGASRLEKITEGFLQSCRSLRVHLLEFAFDPADVQKVLSTANAWSPPPLPAKSNQYQGTFQSFLGVRALHLEVSVQPLMTRQGGVECALFLELRLGQSLLESAWAHVLVWSGTEAFPGDARGGEEPDEPMSAMQVRLPKGCVCSSLQRVARGSVLQQALTSHGTVRTLLAFEPCRTAEAQ
ncbi:unnamed protein product [Symbiodinium necroappetens]|uniref:Uncharacterized protein n=1 Tax=Symbiodinium necroappetens TaxID=1628268 RepID=A0A812RML1_9DINO|nr:unnamed protein product [Symbiodinium necroappetens]